MPLPSYFFLSASYSNIFFLPPVRLTLIFEVLAARRRINLSLHTFLQGISPVLLKYVCSHLWGQYLSGYPILSKNILQQK